MLWLIAVGLSSLQALGGMPYRLRVRSKRSSINGYKHDKMRCWVYTF